MSEIWQWVFSIIGVVAFLMAFPFFLQLLFGQPQIGYRFGQRLENEDKLLTLHLINQPINNKILRFLRVSRMTAREVYLRITIINTSTKQIVGKIFAPDIIMSESNKGVRVSMPPTILMANITLVKWQKSNNSSVLLCGKQLISLSEGKYIVQIELGLDGSILKLKQVESFNVGENADDLKWEDNNILIKIYLVRR